MLPFIHAIFYTLSIFSGSFFFSHPLSLCTDSSLGGESDLPEQAGHSGSRDPEVPGGSLQHPGHSPRSPDLQRTGQGELHFLRYNETPRMIAAVMSQERFTQRCRHHL